MKTLVGALLVLVVSMVSATEAPHPTDSAQNAKEHAAHEGHTAPVLPAGKRWATDEPLRTGMSRIGDATARAVIAGQPVSAATGDALAQTVEQNVTYIVQHCQLQPDADAALHVIIGRMMTAASQLKGDASRDTGLKELTEALAEYRRTFDHSPTLPGK
ncbi:MAG TPA: hypothetical protein VFS47_07125 [Steroidobacteraceae bacterium]|jgi:hypothetical protein|nr:hypothetical protein [Steroidobacteraceae bacterium]